MDDIASTAVAVHTGVSDDSYDSAAGDFSAAHAPDEEPRDTPVLRVCPAPSEEPFAPQPEQILEALLFAADTALSAARLAELLGVGTARDAVAHIDALNERYAAQHSSFRIEHVAGGYQMQTLATYRPWLAKLNRQRLETRLSPAAMETLSIIAYKQPIIRADVESIRGVASGEVINRLREMGLVKIIGRAEIVGRPLMYGTTKKFLDTFGLASLDELPTMETLKLRPAQRTGSRAPELGADAPDAVAADSLSAPVESARAARA